MTIMILIITLVRDIHNMSGKNSHTELRWEVTVVVRSGYLYHLWAYKEPWARTATELLLLAILSLNLQQYLIIKNHKELQWFIIRYCCNC